jgi:purine nucleoside phosphorylase
MNDGASGANGIARCLYVHPDNVIQARRELRLNVAVVARPDAFMERTGVTQVLVETDAGVHTRAFLAKHNAISFLVIYGRVDRQRTTSAELNYALTQEVVSYLGIRCLIGTFVVGSVRADDQAGTVYIPSDFVGLGSHQVTRARGRGVGFRTIDMYEPFCPAARSSLAAQLAAVDFPARAGGVYACFHGWPRVETQAELRRYEHEGYDIVGQTLDPEATLAKEAGTHYAALAATVDDSDLRERLIAGDASARRALSGLVIVGRERMFELFLAALPALNDIRSGCDCAEQAARRQRRSDHFYYRPDYLCLDRNEVASD